MVESGWQVTHAGIDVVLDPTLAPSRHPGRIPGCPVLSGLQLLTSRRNGLVSLHTVQPSVEGVWLSKTLLLPTCNVSSITQAAELGLSLNAMASIDGYLTASLVKNGATLLAAVPTIGNVMDELVRWRNQTTLLDETNPVTVPRAMQGAAVQLQVSMKEAHLFSFKFECIGAGDE